MRRIILACIVLALACGLAWATAWPSHRAGIVQATTKVSNPNNPQHDQHYTDWMYEPVDEWHVALGSVYTFIPWTYTASTFHKFQGRAWWCIPSKGTVRIRLFAPGLATTAVSPDSVSFVCSADSSFSGRSATTGAIDSIQIRGISAAYGFAGAH